MGNNTSNTSATSGTLKGAYPPPLPNAPLPPKLRSEKKKFAVTVPHDKKGGDTMTVELDGEAKEIKIPVYKQDGEKKFKPGDKFLFVADPPIDKVIASTLPALPGAVTLEVKPMIWAIAKSSDYANPNSVAKLMQTAHSELLQKTLDVGCNAALGVNTSVTTDRSGEYGQFSFIIVCLTATPAVVVASSELPATMATAVPIEPYLNY
jgi:hypothetical protein